MKVIGKYVIVLGFLTGLLGCRIEFFSGFTALFKNDSGVNITVITDTETISIDQGEIYYQRGGDIGGAHFYPFNSRQITVIFNGDRYISYDDRDEGAFNNPLRYSNYETTKKVIDKHRTDYEYRYTFVPEQYEMAEPYDPDAQE